MMGSNEPTETPTSRRDPFSQVPAAVASPVQSSECLLLMYNRPSLLPMYLMFLKVMFLKACVSPLTMECRPSSCCCARRPITTPSSYDVATVLGFRYRL